MISREYMPDGYTGPCGENEPDALYGLNTPVLTRPKRSPQERPDVRLSGRNFRYGDEVQLIGPDNSVIYQVREPYTAALDSSRGLGIIQTVDEFISVPGAKGIRIANTVTRNTTTPPLVPDQKNTHILLALPE